MAEKVEWTSLPYRGEVDELSVWLNPYSYELVVSHDL